MARENIMDAIGDIAREKGIDQDRLVSVIQEAVTQAAKRKFKQFEDIEARINIDSGELEVFRYKVVAEEPDDLENQIPLEEARKLDSLAEPGDEVEYEIDNKELSRVIAQTARQLIFQKIREAERETIFENFKDRVGEVLNGVVSRTERGRTFVTIGQTEAILYRREQIPHERYTSGDHIRVILLDVLNDPKEPSLLVISRADPELLIKLFEMEVPEVYDGIVEIVDAAREPGRRAKIAVRSHDPDVDAVGACVGLRGSRVQSIISELRGEKIDIIHYSDDFPTYVANALAPAELSRIKIDEEEKKIDAEVDPDQLSLAIGRFGQNVRLASKLVGYKIDVMSPQDAAVSLEEQIRQSLLASQAQLGIGVDTGEEEASAEEATEEGVEGSATPSAELAESASEEPAPEPTESVESTGSTLAESGTGGEDAPAPEAAGTEIPGTEGAAMDAPPTAGTEVIESTESTVSSVAVDATEATEAEAPVSGETAAEDAATETSATSAPLSDPLPEDAGAEVDAEPAAEPVEAAAVESGTESDSGDAPEESESPAAVNTQTMAAEAGEETPAADSAAPAEESPSAGDHSTGEEEEASKEKPPSAGSSAGPDGVEEAS